MHPESEDGGARVLTPGLAQFGVAPPPSLHPRPVPAFGGSASPPIATVTNVHGAGLREGGSWQVAAAMLGPFSTSDSKPAPALPASLPSPGCFVDTLPEFCVRCHQGEKRESNTLRRVTAKLADRVHANLARLAAITSTDELRAGLLAAGHGEETVTRWLTVLPQKPGRYAGRLKDIRIGSSIHKVLGEFVEEGGGGAAASRLCLFALCRSVRTASPSCCAPCLRCVPCKNCAHCDGAVDPRVSCSVPLRLRVAV